MRFEHESEDYISVCALNKKGNYVEIERKAMQANGTVWTRLRFKGKE